MSLTIIVLAAGKGTRMVSEKPKVLHTLAGKPLLGHVLDTARALHPEQIIVVTGHGAEQVEAVCAGDGIEFVRQARQLGTGHAVLQAMPRVQAQRVLVLYGDVPLTSIETLNDLVAASKSSSLAVLSMDLQDPTGYGRIVRDNNGQILAIVEQKDATEEQLQIRECNTGILCAHSAPLNDWLNGLNNDNEQGEYYLTDCVAACVASSSTVESRIIRSPVEAQGVNDHAQLHELERYFQRTLAHSLMMRGVSICDAARIDIRGELECGRDVTIDVNCVFEGQVELADGVRVGASCVLRNCKVGRNTEIHPNSVLENSVIGEDCQVGPFARIRPGTRLARGAKVGNFVEIKKSEVGKGSKISHLSYVGDATIGEEVNIGAGTITCNYDGVNKHRTSIGDGAFIGSNSSLVAPVEVGKKATIGAGSTIAGSAPPDQLTIARSKQRTIPGWKRPSKKEN